MLMISRCSGDFDQTQYDYNGIITRFFKRGDKFYVNTDGPDGTLQDYQINYTFGVEPLQQYLIELPGGRLQALTVAWDSRTKQQGGQRWFHLYPKEKIDFKDELHWTKRSQNWNFMCAECHSTDLKKNFDLATNQFSTTWSEINVSCEACHGPSSRHLDWANKKPGWEKYRDKGLVFLLDERNGVSWDLSAEIDTAVRSKNRNTSKEINTCARCHSRRGILTEEYQHGKPLMDTHRPALLTEGLYHPDGQIKEEVYVYGSFIQSKMYHKGVTCSDCHQPHSLKLRAPENKVCLRCHKSENFETEKHHFHPLNSKGARCVECHMPASNFMVIDGRRDHSIRIPRPDLSMKINTPNACNNCHTEKTASWANTQMQTWYGKDWSPGWHFGETLFDARLGKPQLEQDLNAIGLTPDIAEIARATAVTLLPAYPGPLTPIVLPKLLADESAMVRLAALSTVEVFPVEQRWKLAGKLLKDPILAVRIEAASVLSVLPRESLTPAQQLVLDKAAQEYIQAQLTNAELPQSHINLGLLYLQQGDMERAEHAYQQAIKLDPDFIAAYINLSDLYRIQQQNDKVEASLMQARAIIGDNAVVEYALGLHYIRIHQMPKALKALAEASQLQPDNARYAYVYAVALNGNGQAERAIKILQQVNELHPYDSDVLIALVTYNKNMEPTGSTATAAPSPARHNSVCASTIRATAPAMSWSTQRISRRSRLTAICWW